VEYIVTNDARRFVHQRQAIDCPWLAPDFSVDLDKNFRHNREKIFSSRYSICQHNLRWNRQFNKQGCFYLFVKRCTFLLTWQDEDNRIHRWVKNVLHCIFPAVKLSIVSFYLHHSRWRAVELLRLNDFLQCLCKLVSFLLIELAIHDCPLI